MQRSRIRQNEWLQSPAQLLYLAGNHIPKSRSTQPLLRGSAVPLFISYSHADKEFVDSLARQLVANRVSVWLDKWEIHAGDSLLTKVQNAISGASALLVVLSKTSVKSDWCTKELNAGLMRELDEKRVIVVPILLEDCPIPTFLREKFYADFRTSFDHGLEVILESIARVTNATQGRVEQLNYHTDWAIDWGDINGKDVFRLTMIDHTKEQPYTILSEITIIGDGDASRWYRKELAKAGGETAREEILLGLEAAMQGDEQFTFRLTDQMPRNGFVTFDLNGGIFGATMTVRRLGMDTGHDTIVRLDGQVKNVGDTIRAIRAQGTPNTDVTSVGKKRAKKSTRKAASSAKHTSSSGKRKSAKR
jgi:hypothetical protein